MKKSPLRLHHHGCFLLRTPLLPLSAYRDWAAAEDPEAYLRQIFGQGVGRDALALASPSLHERLQAGGDATMAASLGNYLSRASYRAAPFGLFASVARGVVGDQTDLASMRQAPLVVRTRLDCVAWARWAEHVVADKALRRRLRFRRNSSLSELGSKFYYVESENLGAVRRYRFSHVQRTDYLHQLIANAEQPQSFARLTALLCEWVGVSESDAEAFIHELVDQQLLIPEIGLLVSSTRGVADDLERLGPLQDQAPVAELQSWLAQLPQGDWRELGDLSQRMQELRQCWNGAVLPDVEPRSVLQMDCYRPGEFSMAESSLASLMEAARWMAHLNIQRVTRLDEFKRQFAERYEDKEVPLDLLFNEEAGIPYPKAGEVISDLTEMIDFPSSRPQGATQVRYGPLERLLYTKIEAAQREGRLAIDIEPAEAQAVYQALDVAPGPRRGAYFKAELLNAEGAPSADGEPWAAITMFTGRSGAEAMGRFSDLAPEFEAMTRHVLAANQADDDAHVVAEVIHVPQDKLANIVTRPVLSHYEIPYLGRSFLPEDRQIPVSDLMVSLQGGRFVLRSRRLNRVVLPRLTATQNFYALSLNVYWFLCFLTHQDHPELQFDWPAMFQAASFLPRLSVCGVVMSPACWRVTPAELQALASSCDQGPDALVRWRAPRRIPRFVTIAQGEDAHAVDLANPVAVRALLNERHPDQGLELREALALNAAEQAGGPQCQIEVIVPVTVETEDQAAAPAPLALHQPQALHQGEPWVYAPGSAWVYFKLYAGWSQLDDVLLSHAVPALRKLEAQGEVDRWFFVRYADPHPHLRLRARCVGGAAAAQLALSQALHAAIGQGLGWKLVQDSYDREVSRYGGLQAIAHAEALFHADSQLVADYLSMTDGAATASQRWLFSSLWLDELLSACGYELEAKAAFFKALAEGFRQESRFGARQKVQLGSAYRRFRTQLDALVLGRTQTPEAQRQREAWQQMRARHLQALRPHVEALKSLAAADRLGQSLSGILESLVHMHCNRMFVAAPRRHETVLYDFQVRIYESRRATAETVSRTPGG